MESDLAGDAGYVPAAYAGALVTHLQTVHPDFLAWEQSKRRLGLGLGAVTAAVTGVVLFYIFALVLHLPSTSSRALAAVTLLAFLLPYGLITRRGAEHFKAQWQLQGKGPTATPVRRDGDVGQAQTFSDDASILNLTNDLARQFDISDVTVAGVAWQTMIPRGRTFVTVRSDMPLFRDHKIYLAEKMEGALSAEEWKPLIASALINYRKLRPRKISWILTIAIPVIALYTAGWFLLPPLFPTTINCANGKCAYYNTGQVILIILGPILAIVMIIVSVVTLQRFGWIADKETAASLGKDRLIASLRRVLEVSPSDSWTVQKRINKLTQADTAAG